MLVAWSPPVIAQQARQIEITIPQILFLQLGRENAVPISVAPLVDSAARFLVLHGFPVNAVLSKGYIIAPGVWSVPLDELSGLKVSLTNAKLGRWNVEVDLVSAENAVIAAAKTIIVVVPPGAPDAQAATHGLDQSPTATPLPPSPRAAQSSSATSLSPADRQQATEFYNFGLDQLKVGNIYAARKFFERAAQLGFAESALALGDTFDVNELAKLNVLGLSPDVAAARTWYERARALGSKAAEERLRRLGQ